MRSGVYPPKFSMKPSLLFYLCVFTVIGVAESIDPWFEQEVVEYDEEGDLFSQEGLLPLHRQPPSPQKDHHVDPHHPAQKSPQKADASVVVMTSDHHHGNTKDAVASELEDQHLIPVKTGSKQKTKPAQTSANIPASAALPKNGAEDDSKTKSATTEKKNATEGTTTAKTDGSTAERKGSERKLLSKEEDVHSVVEDDVIVEIRPEAKICEEPEKDVDCLFEEEELIPVNKKPETTKKAAPKRNHANTAEKARENSNSQNKGTAEEGNHVSQRKLLEIPESSSNEQRVSNDTKIDIESKAADNGNEVIPAAPQEEAKLQLPAEEEEEKEEEEDNENLEDLIWRVKRQVGAVNNQEFSGDTSPAITASTTPATTPDPDFLIRTTGNITYLTDGWNIEVNNCAIKEAEVKEKARVALENYFSNVTNVTISFEITVRKKGQNGYTISWKLNMTGLGPTPENEIDRILLQIQNLSQPKFTVGNCATDHSNYNKTDFVNKVNTTLSDPCKSPDPCPLGYEKCELVKRGVGRCFSRCLLSGVNAKCQNGAPCITRPKGQPTCECKPQYTGQYCEALAGDGSRPTAPPSVTANVTVPGFPIPLNMSQAHNRSKDEIKVEVKTTLINHFKARNLTDFDIEVTDVVTAPNGTVLVNWNFKLGNANDDRQVRAQEIINSLGNAPASLQFTTFNSSYKVPQVDLTNLSNKVVERLRNPCMDTVCAFGYNCTLNFDYGQPMCTHKCLSNAYANKCKHGTCELNRQTGEPYCLCTNKFKGEFCDQSKASSAQTALSTPEIIGTTAGSLIVAAALASCCLWFLLCRKKSQRDISFSYLEDQDQDIEGFSDASSKLHNCYLDRPRVTVKPLDIYGMNQEFNS